MKKTNKFYTGLSFAIIMIILNITLGLTMEGNHTTVQITRLIISSIVSGAIGGVLWVWLTGVFSKWGFFQKSTEDKTRQDKSTPD